MTVRVSTAHSLPSIISAAQSLLPLISPTNLPTPSIVNITALLLPPLPPKPLNQTYSYYMHWCENMYGTLALQAAIVDL